MSKGKKKRRDEFLIKAGIITAALELVKALIELVGEIIKNLNR